MKKPLLLLLTLLSAYANAQWESLQLYAGNVNCHVQVGSETYVGTSSGVYKTSTGATWQAVSTNLPDIPVVALFFDEGIMYAGLSPADDAVYTSADTGVTWQLKTNGLAGTAMYSSFCKCGNRVYLAYPNGMFYTTTHGDTWLQASAPFSSMGAIYSDGTNLYGTQLNAGQIQKSVDGTQNWYMDTVGMGPEPSIGKFFFTGDTMYAVGYYVYASYNKGETWQRLSDSSTASYAAMCFDGAVFYQRGTSVSSSKALYKFALGTNNWVDISDSLPTVDANYLFTMDDKVWLDKNGRLFEYTGSNWVETGNTGMEAYTWTALLVDADTIYAGTGNGIYRLTPATTGWQRSYDGINTTSGVTSIHRFGTKLFAATNGSGIYKSADGAHWSPNNTGLSISGLYAHCLADNGTNLFVGTAGAKVFRYTGSNNWASFGNGLPGGTVNSLAIQGDYIYAAISAGSTDTPGVYYSSLTSPLWIPLREGMPIKNVKCVASSGASRIDAGLEKGGNYSYSNQNDSWRPISEEVMKNRTINCIIPYVAAGTDTGVYMGAGDVEGWEPYIGLEGLNIAALEYRQPYLYAAAGNQIWSSKLGTGINEAEQQALWQLYPNPAISQFTITGYAADVTKVMVQDMLGRILLQRNIPKGEKAITIETGDFPAGLLLVTLSGSDGGVSAKKVVVNSWQ